MHSILPAAEAAVVAHMYLPRHPHQVTAAMQHQRLLRLQDRQVHQIIQGHLLLLHIRQCVLIIITGIPIIKGAAYKEDIIQVTPVLQVAQV